MAAIDDLTHEVSEATTVMQSAATLLAGLKTQLDAAIAELENGGNADALHALSATLDTSGNELAAAVVANTPAPGAPPVEPGEGGTVMSPTGARLRR